eukprot:scaffold204429_cov26-Tisochrysis_lutea.AAC.2
MGCCHGPLHAPLAHSFTLCLAATCHLPLAPRALSSLIEVVCLPSFGTPAGATANSLRVERERVLRGGREGAEGMKAFAKLLVAFRFPFGGRCDAAPLAARKGHAGPWPFQDVLRVRLSLEEALPCGVGTIKCAFHDVQVSNLRVSLPHPRLW